MNKDLASKSDYWPPRLRPIKAARHLLRVAMGIFRKRPIAQDLYALIYGNPVVRAVRFMNLGHFPLPNGFLHDPAWASETLQAGLYHRVLSEGAALLGQAPQSLVEVACGRGGGTLYAQALFPETRLTVLDAQPDAVRAARELANPGCTNVLVGLGGALPFAPASFDMVISVEAMMNLGREEFLAESARVLRPGGILSVSGFQNCPPAALREQLMRDAEASGLRLLTCQDITKEMLAACDIDSKRREQVIRRGPRIGHGYMRNFAQLPDTPAYRSFLEGRRCYFLAAFIQSESH